MATNLKQKGGDKKPAKEEKPASAGIQLDLRWILAGLGLIVITMGSVILGVYLAPNKIIVQETEREVPVEKLPVKLVPGPSIPIALGEVVNLKDSHFLRFSVVFQFVASDKLFPPAAGEKKKGSNPLDSYMPMMKDAIVSAASRHASEDLMSLQGKDKLKEEIKRDVNHEFQAYADPDPQKAAANPVPEVLRVFFTDFVIQ